MRAALLAAALTACGARRAPPEPASTGAALAVTLDAGVPVHLVVLPVRPLTVQGVDWSAVGRPGAHRVTVGRAVSPAAPLRLPLAGLDLGEDRPAAVQGTVHARGRLGTPYRQTFRLPLPPPAAPTAAPLPSPPEPR